MTALDTLFDWPGLSPLKGELPEALPYQRGVWGKAHGVATDYRWLARSEGFFGHDRELSRELVLGTEDTPRTSTYWRALPYGHYAVGFYASRARDAAARGNFSEKQILAVAPSASIPPALSALVLLPHAARLDDDVWWSRRRNQPWEDREFFLRIPAEDHRPLEIHQSALEDAIEAGRQVLETWGEETLTELYTRLLSGKPAWLLQSPSPLPPESLAVLLLPLRADLAANVSIASWIPSSRADAGKLEQCWSIGIRPDSLSLSGWTAVELAPSEEARRMAQALLTGDPECLVEDSCETLPEARSSAESPSVEPSPEEPVFISAGPRPKPPESLSELDAGKIFGAIPSLPRVEMPAKSSQTATEWRPSEEELLRPGLRLPLRQISGHAPAILGELFEFAQNADRRWLKPDELPPFDSAIGGDDAEILKSWIHDMGHYLPEYEMIHSGPLASVDLEQWEVKIDLLKSAALICDPRSSTYHEIGELKSGRIPPLFFLGCLAESSWQRLRDLGDETLQELIRQSRACSSPAQYSRFLPLLHRLEDRISSRRPFEI